MEDNENKSKFSIKKLLNMKGKAFYLALAICLACIGGAAYSSINSWRQFNSPKESLGSSKIHEKNKKDEAKKQEELKEVAKPAKPSEQKASEARLHEEKQKQPGQDQNAATKPANAKAPKLKTVYPTGKTVLKKFSADAPVFSETMNDWRVHDGVDFEAEKGSIIKSISSGKIQTVKTDPLFGKVIIAEHSDGIVAEYCGLDEIKVKEGANVKMGDELGTLGEAPCESTEKSHFHLVIKKGGKPVNPIDVLGK